MPVVTAGVSPQRHANAMKFVEVLGGRKGLEENVATALRDGRDMLIRALPQVDPRYFEELTRLTRERFRADECADVYVEVFERYFTGDELGEMAAAMQSVHEQKTARLPRALKEKIDATAPAIESEIMGRCRELAAKAAEEASREIDREHPEWTRGKRGSGIAK